MRSCATESHFPAPALQALSVCINKCFLAKNHRSFINWININRECKGLNYCAKGNINACQSLFRRLGQDFKLTISSQRICWTSTQPPVLNTLVPTTRLEQNFCTENETRLEETKPVTDLQRSLGPKAPPKNKRVERNEKERKSRGSKRRENKKLLCFNFKTHQEFAMYFLQRGIEYWISAVWRTAPSIPDPHPAFQEALWTQVTLTHISSGIYFFTRLAKVNSHHSKQEATRVSVCPPDKDHDLLSINPQTVQQADPCFKSWRHC